MTTFYVCLASAAHLNCEICRLIKKYNGGYGQGDLCMPKIRYIALLILLSIFIYLNSFNNAFVWDDYNVIVDNKEYIPQQGDSLGERMLSAFQKVFQEGAGKAVIIGSDCPFIDAEVILQAFKKLSSVPCVIGPSKDGGYYLLGLSSFNEKLFKGIDWSTDKVLDQTQEIIKNIGMDHSLMKESYDIDTWEDVMQLKKDIISSDTELSCLKNVTEFISSIKKK